MRILNLGSMNFDKVYQVEHFVGSGETILSGGFSEFLGGKGLNQSVALARAGAQVYHAGAVGPDGNPLLDYLRGAGADVRYVLRKDTVSGHAIIQNAAGQNCIIVCGGANQCVSCEDIRTMLDGFGSGDLLLVQNETSNVPFAMREAHRRGMKIAFNASPITPELLRYPLELVDCFLINEVEGKALAGCSSEEYEDILTRLAARFPKAAIVLTVGEHGVLYQDETTRAAHPAYPVQAVDTTAAGDTFCGYFLAGRVQGMSVSQALQYACKAGALAVSRCGAAPSIPHRQEVLAFDAAGER